jgi:hypothetical protein
MVRLGPNYPASTSNIHPAPKFQFKDTIKAPRKPVESESLLIEGKVNGVHAPPTVEEDVVDVVVTTTTNDVIVETTNEKNGYATLKPIHYFPPEMESMEVVTTSETPVTKGQTSRIRKVWKGIVDFII